MAAVGEPDRSKPETQAPDGDADDAAAQLSRILRQWWQDDGRKQASLAGQLARMDVEVSQETLSRYLSPTNKLIAREDVIRALHQALDREPPELAQALALRQRATQVRTAQLRNRPADTPSSPDDVLTAPRGPARRLPARPGWWAAGAVVLLGAAGLGLWWANPSPTVRAPTPSATSGPGAASAVPATAAALAPCQGATCLGLDPSNTVCKTDAVTAAVDTDPAIDVELRYSARCHAAWAKISRTSQGDVARINNESTAREYTQISGRDAHTTMVPVRRLADVRACALTASRTVCAVIPTSHT